MQISLINSIASWQLEQKAKSAHFRKESLTTYVRRKERGSEAKKADLCRVLITGQQAKKERQIMN